MGNFFALIQLKFLNGVWYNWGLTLLPKYCAPWIFSYAVLFIYTGHVFLAWMEPFFCFEISCFHFDFRLCLGLLCCPYGLPCACGMNTSQQLLPFFSLCQLIDTFLADHIEWKMLISCPYGISYYIHIHLVCFSIPVTSSFMCLGLICCPYGNYSACGMNRSQYLAPFYSLCQLLFIHY